MNKELEDIQEQIIELSIHLEDSSDIEAIYTLTKEAYNIGRVHEKIQRGIDDAKAGRITKRELTS